MTTIDATPLITQILQAFLAAFIPILLALIAWVATWLKTYLHVQIDQTTMDNLESAISKSADYGLTQVLNVIKQKGWDHPTVKSGSLAASITYLIERFPGTLAQVGIDPRTLEGRQQITTLIERILPHRAALLVTSPATPSADAGKDGGIASPEKQIREEIATVSGQLAATSDDKLQHELLSKLDKLRTELDQITAAAEVLPKSSPPPPRQVQNPPATAAPSAAAP